MFIRLTLILILSTAQMLPFAAATAFASCSGTISTTSDDPVAAHRAVCGDSCCCPPDNCPCIGAPGSGEIPTPAPVPATMRVDTSRIDMILSRCGSVLTGFEFAMRSFQPVPAGEPIRASHNSIQSRIGVWLT